MIVAADYGGNVTIQAPFFAEQLKADKNGQKVDKPFDLPPWRTRGLFCFRRAARVSGK
jgi:hypothetical protein